MKIKCKWFEKKVDERQEMDLLRVEHFCFWLMYYMLLAAVLIQSIFFEDGYKMAAAEWIIFMSISIISLAGWVRKGVWGYHTRKVPGIRSYLIYSIVSSVVAGTFFGVLFAFKWDDISPESIATRIMIMVISLFVVIFPAFLIVGALTKRREKQLADQDFDEKDEEN